jgi:glycosyltransferase involved in cell wall biosynthesis
MDGGFLVPIALFAAVAAVFVLPSYFRSRDEKGQPVPPELIEALQVGGQMPIENPQSRAARDLRVGIIWLAVGLGCVAIGGAFYAGLYYVGGATETFASFAAIGAIPIFVGLAFMLLSALGRNKR